MADVKRMPVAEFRAQGYLQELNRQFLHPLGLALEVSIGEDGTETLSGVWDYRDDPEGIYYGPNEIDAAKAANVARLRMLRREPRGAALGYWVQPVV